MAHHLVRGSAGICLSALALPGGSGTRRDDPGSIGHALRSVVLAAQMKSPVRTRSDGRSWSPVTVIVDGHRTSVRLEPIMWDALRGLAAYQRVPLDELVTWIDKARDPRDNLSAAIRVYIVEFYQRNAVLP